jgi:hypothetical protein
VPNHNSFGAQLVLCGGSPALGSWWVRVCTVNICHDCPSIVPNPEPLGDGAASTGMPGCIHLTSSSSSSSSEPSP